jgi:hypothetical protein
MEVDLQHEKVSEDIQSMIKVSVVDTQHEKESTVETQHEKESTVDTQHEKESTVETQWEKVSVIDMYGRLRKSLMNPLTKFFEIFMKKCMNNIRQVKMALSYLVFLSTEADFYAMTTFMQ